MEFINILSDIFTIPLYLFLFLFIGKFFYGDMRGSFKDQYLITFIEIVLGFVLVITTYAIVRTMGKSIMVLLLLLLCFQYFYLKIKPDMCWYREIGKVDLKAILVIFGLSLLFLGVQLYRHDYFNPDFVKLGWGDYGYYSNLAESFNVYGIEKGASWHNYFKTDVIDYRSNPLPYHYFELWTQALFLNTSLNHGVFVFIYMFTPFVCALVAFGFFVFGRSLLRINSGYKSFILLIIAFLMPLFMGKLPFLLGGFRENIVYYPRSFMFYILFISFFVFYRKGFKIMSVVFLAMLSVMNILYLPTVAIVLVLLAGFHYYRNKHEKSLAMRTLFLAIFPVVFVFIFYFVLFKSESQSSLNMSAFSDMKAYVMNGFHYYFRLQLARVWFFYLPCFLIALWYFWNNRKTSTRRSYSVAIILVVITFELVSLIFASFIPHLESRTFNSIVLNPMLAVITFTGLMYALNHIKAFASKILVGLVSVQLLYALAFVLFNIENANYEGQFIYSKTFLKEVVELNITNKVGCFYKNKAKRDRSPFAAKSNLSWFTAIFDVKGNGYFQVNLSTYIREDQIPFESVKGVVFNSPMFKYGSAKLHDNSGLSRDAIDIAFIKDYDIGYIIFHPGVKIPNYLLPLGKQTIKDESSKVQIMIL